MPSARRPFRLRRAILYEPRHTQEPFFRIIVSEMTYDIIGTNNTGVPYRKYRTLDSPSWALNARTIAMYRV
jgi:hypothetical protein